MGKDCTAENYCADCAQRLAFIAEVDGASVEQTVRDVDRGEPAHLYRGLRSRKFWDR